MARREATGPPSSERQRANDLVTARTRGRWVARFRGPW